MYIRNKLFSLYAAITIVPLFIIVAGSYIICDSALTAKAREQLSNVSYETTAYLSDYINSRSSDVEILSNMYFLEQYMTGDKLRRDSYERMLKKMLSSFLENNVYSELIVVDYAGRTVVI